MQMLNQLTSIVLTPFDKISQQVTFFFDWLLQKGVREDTLIIILIAGGVSVLLLVLGIMLAAFKYYRNRAASKPARVKKTKKAAPSAADQVKGPDPRFAIFKKRRKKEQPAATAPIVDNASTEQVKTLTDIERDMLALKELFESGHIDAEVYVEETRKLYETAQQYI